MKIVIGDVRHVSIVIQIGVKSVMTHMGLFQMYTIQEVVKLPVIQIAVCVIRLEIKPFVLIAIQGPGLMGMFAPIAIVRVTVATIKPVARIATTENISTMALEEPISANHVIPHAIDALTMKSVHVASVDFMFIQVTHVRFVRLQMDLEYQDTIVSHVLQIA